MVVEGKVIVYGAGISGMIAAFNLAREGYEVVVRDREEGFGGSRVFNPSTHVTPLDLEATSEYIGIDISTAFHPMESIDLFLHDYRIPLPVAGSYAVERSSRPTSLDALLYRHCLEAGVSFEFGRPLRGEEVDSLSPNTIIACGLNPEAYDYLGVPYIHWYAWMARGESSKPNYAWNWLDESVTEYGYISFCNGIYFNLLFSYGKEVDALALERYQDFMSRVMDMEMDGWEYIQGAVPLAVPDNPRLFRKNLIMCGTISGAMDPFMGFGISGALVTGKVSALAVTNKAKAEEEFARFTRNFARVFQFKREVWYGLRPRVDLMEELARILGPQRSLSLIVEGIRRGRKSSAIPGFGPLGCH